MQEQCKKLLDSFLLGQALKQKMPHLSVKFLLKKKGNLLGHLNKLSRFWKIKIC